MHTLFRTDLIDWLKKKTNYFLRAFAAVTASSPLWRFEVQTLRFNGKR